MMQWNRIHFSNGIFNDYWIIINWNTLDVCLLLVYLFIFVHFFFFCLSFLNSNSNPWNYFFLVLCCHHQHEIYWNLARISLAPSEMVFFSLSQSQNTSKRHGKYFKIPTENDIDIDLIIKMYSTMTTNPHNGWLNQFIKFSFSSTIYIDYAKIWILLWLFLRKMSSSQTFNAQHYSNLFFVIVDLNY